MNKLGLGTVQFGSNYGISNKTGRPSMKEIKTIVNTAYKNGVTLIDTAPAYKCENILGKFLYDKDDIRVVTKTPVFKSEVISSEDVLWLENCFLNSLASLQSNSIYGLLVHQCEDLLKLGGERIWNKLLEFKKQNKVKKIGVSVYNPDEIDRCLDYYPLDIIQHPLNVLDQRLIKNGYLAKLKKNRIEVHVRSIFLQGLLLMNPDELNSYFSPIKKHLKGYHSLIKDLGVTPLESALSFALNIDGICAAIIGVNSNDELVDLLNSTGAMSRCKNICYSQFGYEEETVINPSKWQY